MGLTTIIAVLIIDTGIAPIMGLQTVKYTTYTPSMIHGTQVAYVATGKAQKQPLCSNVMFYSCDYIRLGMVTCLEYANRNNFDFINISASGEGSDPVEKELIQSLTNKGTIVVVAAGNDNIPDLRLHKIYPASYLYDGLINFRVVSDNNYAHGNQGIGVLQDKAEWVLPVAENILTPSKGTSFAAPSYLHKQLRNYCSELLFETRDLTCKKMN